MQERRGGEVDETRDPARAADLQQSGVEIVQGDLVVKASLERACAERPSLPVRTASAQDLVAEGKTCDPLDDLVGLGHRPIDRASVLEWVEGRDLMTDQAVWVPVSRARRKTASAYGRAIVTDSAMGVRDPA